MKDKIGFLQRWNSQANMIENSSDRMFSILVLVFAMVMTLIVTILGYLSNEKMVIIAPISGALFLQIAGSVLIYLFQSKKDERKVDESTKIKELEIKTKTDETK